MPPPSASRNLFSDARSFEPTLENIRVIICTSCTSPVAELSPVTGSSCWPVTSDDMASIEVRSMPWLWIVSG